MEKKELSASQKALFIETLKARFQNNMHRHNGLHWEKIQVKLETNSDKLWSLNAMEETGGEPDVVKYDEGADSFVFYDCAKESPSGRRSFCYDKKAREARKANKPQNSAMEMASEMGISMLTEQEYRFLHELEKVDAKTSSWVLTPPEIREKGGALFCDYRYAHVFVYHNGADSYYAARGFRASVSI